MAQAGSPSANSADSRLARRHKSRRREGSLAAALVQSLALAVISTAGAYPSWVLVTNSRRGQFVLGASWAINQAEPPEDSPLLGPSGGPIMIAIATCCLGSVVTGSLAIASDFLGQVQCRALGLLLHFLTAFLTTGSAALGSTLLGLVRGRVRFVPELQPLQLKATPGQSLFLSFLACALAATATGLSCASPAVVSSSFSSRDLARPRMRRRRRREVSATATEDSVAAAAAGYVWWPCDLDSGGEDDEPRPSLDWLRNVDLVEPKPAEAPQAERAWWWWWWWRQPPAPPEEPGRGDAGLQHS